MKVTTSNFKQTLKIVLSINKEVLEARLTTMTQYALARKNIRDARLMEKIGELKIF